MATSTHKFTLKKGSKEVPDRFGGLEIEYSYPADYATLTAMAQKVVAEHKPKDGEAAPTVEQVLYALSMGQSGHLNIQKAIKGRLASDDEALKSLSVQERVTNAVKYGEQEVVTVPGTRRGEGKGTKVARAVAQAETATKRADAAVLQLEKAYLAMPKAARASFAASLVEQGILTKERLAELDAQK